MSSSDFTTYHVDQRRSGTYTGANLTADDIGRFEKYATIDLGSAVRGVPLFVGGWTFATGPNAETTHDLVIAATSDNRVIAYGDDQLRSGKPPNSLWSTTLGKPLRRVGSNIPYPLGVCGSAVIDRAAGRVYALALHDDGGTELTWNIFASTSGNFDGPNFGRLDDGRHHFFIGDFFGRGRSEVLFYFENDGNWWVGDCHAFLTANDWTAVSNTLGKVPGDPNFGQVFDGRPFWIGRFRGAPRDEVLFYSPGDGNWWLGSIDPGSGRFVWAGVSNTLGKIAGEPNFGQVTDGRPIWIGNFTGSGRTQILFYFPGDGNWWLATYADATRRFAWTLVGNTLGKIASDPDFGQVADGRPFWIGNFRARGRTEVMFYFPGDGNWWIGGFDGAAVHLSWSGVSNTLGKVAGEPSFGQIADGRPIWIGNFRGDNRDEVLFYFPGDGNWWDGSYADATGRFAWTFMGNTLGKIAGEPNFGQLTDGKHHFLTGAFTDAGRTEILFNFEGDDNWFVASFNSQRGQFAWSLAGNTAGFGTLWDGRPLWVGQFAGSTRSDIVFYSPGDSNWWFGSFAHGRYHMHALDLNTGASVSDAILADAGATGRPSLDGRTVDQRSALNLVGGRLYAGFADFAAYDLGPYHGWIVSCETANLANQQFFSTTHTVLGGGVWGPGGLAAASDGTLYAATGNMPNADDAYWSGLGTSHPGDHRDFFEAVIRLSPELSVLDWYIPTNAKAMNTKDQDLAGSSPLVLPAIGGREMLVVTGKDGDVYLLDRLHLGHWGGELWRDNVFGQESKCAPAYYQSPAGEHYVYVIGGGLPGLIAYSVTANAAGAQLQPAWMATGGQGIPLGDIPGSPLVMVLPAGGAVVWIVDDTVPALRGFDALTGVERFNSAAFPANALGPIAHFPPISCGSRAVYVGTKTGVACYGPR